MIAVIDNYDSFTWNLVNLLRECTEAVSVWRNDEITPEELAARQPRGILLSPGPGQPAQSGISARVIEMLGNHTPVLGVCLGHQLIGELFGAKVVKTEPMHGKTSMIHHDGKGIFEGMENPFQAMRYHSLALDPQLPPRLICTARTQDGIVMGIRHSDLPLEGVQFHPESILTPQGSHILRNWVSSLK